MHPLMQQATQPYTLIRALLDRILHIFLVQPIRANCVPFVFETVVVLPDQSHCLQHKRRKINWVNHPATEVTASTCSTTSSTRLMSCLARCKRDLLWLVLLEPDALLDESAKERASIRAKSLREGVMLEADDDREKPQLSSMISAFSTR